MIRFIEPYMTQSDARGSMRGLINFGEWREANLIRSDAGMTRGNHYHGVTTEAFIMLEGRVQISIERIVDGERTGDVQTVQAKAGDVFLIEPQVCHVFEILEPAAWINLLDVVLDPAQPDIHRPR